MALSIPRGYGEPLEQRAGRRRCRSIADGSDANSASVALGYATNLIAVVTRRNSAHARRVLPAGMPVPVGVHQPRVRVWFNRGSKAATS